MKYEVEKKYHVDDLDAIEKTVQAIGSTLGLDVLQCDTHLSHPSRDFAQTDEALRLRHDGVSALLTYKGPRIDASTKTRREVEVELPHSSESRAEFVELLQLTGFSIVVEI